MNSKRRMFVALATAVFMFVHTPTAQAISLRINSSYTQRKIRSGKFPIHSACMMPPQGHLAKIGFKGAEGMTRESEAWAEKLENLVETRLRSDGITVNSATDPVSSGASNDEIARVISQVEEKFNALAPLMDKKPKRIEKSAYTLGDQVGMLPCSENSDILVFVTGVGQVLTKGRTAVTLIAGGPTEAADVFVTMADAKTGEIIGLIKAFDGFGFLENTENDFGHRLNCQLWVMNIGTARKNPNACGD